MGFLQTEETREHERITVLELFSVHYIKMTLAELNISHSTIKKTNILKCSYSYRGVHDDLFLDRAAAGGVSSVLEK